VKPEVQVKLDRQKEVVELAFANLERVTDMERYGPAGNPARDELLGGTGPWPLALGRLVSGD
jgi:hypothetical protein